jgi:hypothetical protein
MDTSAPDYPEAAALAVEKLADVESLNIQSVWNQIQALRDDTIRYRVLADSRDELALPLFFAASMLQGAQQMLLSAAHNVLKPRSHHPRLSRSEAQQIVESALFRHTEKGSFVLKVSCPLQALDDSVGQLALLSHEPRVPFVRRTTMMLCQGVQELVGAIESDQLQTLVDRARSTTATALSSNLCEAILRFQDTTLRNSIELSVDWSPLLRPPPELLRPIRIQHDYFPRIEEVRRALRPDDGPRKDIFIGTVERLDGEMGPEGKRLGEVQLAILLPDGESVRSRVHLNAEQYAAADRAHMNDGTYIRVDGTLHPGRQIRALTDIQSFELLAPGTGKT